MFTAALTSPAPSVPLGLKYTILKGSTQVPVDTVFHAGDRIQLSVETNSEVEDGNNRVEGFHSYVLPPKSRLIFDEQTGTEKLFVVFSREPEPNLEKLIYSLKDVAPASTPKPSAPNRRRPNPRPPIT